MLNMQKTSFPRPGLESRALNSALVCSLVSFGTLGTVNLSVMANKALVGQATGTPCAFETVIVPGLIFVVNHTGSSSKSCQERKQLQDGDSSFSRGWVRPPSSNSHSNCIPCSCNLTSCICVPKTGSQNYTGTTPLAAQYCCSQQLKTCVVHFYNRLFSLDPFSREWSS